MKTCGCSKGMAIQLEPALLFGGGGSCGAVGGFQASGGCAQNPSVVTASVTNDDAAPWVTVARLNLPHRIAQRSRRAQIANIVDYRYTTRCTLVLNKQSLQVQQLSNTLPLKNPNPVLCSTMSAARNTQAHTWCMWGALPFKLQCRLAAYKECNMRRLPQGCRRLSGC